MGTFADAMKSVERARVRYEKAVTKVFVDNAEKMQKQAREDYYYTHRTHKLKNSTKAEVAKDDRYLTLRFWIDPEKVTVKGWNYGWIQNDGSLSRYKKGRISAPVTPTDRIRKGVRHDDFMGRTWEKYLPKIMKGLNNASKKLGK